jgi:hypothetical protein
MLKEFHQPSLIHIVEEAFYICLYNVVDSFVLYCVTQRYERFMTTAGWTESIRVFYEVLFVYCVQYPNHPGLNKFVLETWYPQRALFGATRLGYVSAPDSLRYVCHPVKPIYQVG